MPVIGQYNFSLENEETKDLWKTRVRINPLPLLTVSRVPSFGFSLLWNTEIRPINNLTAASKCSSKRKSHMSLTLSKKLKMVKLREGGMLKFETGWKLVLLPKQLAKLWMKPKNSWIKLKVLLSKHMNEKKEKQPYCQHGESLNGRDRRSNQTPHSLKPKPSPEEDHHSLQIY